LDIHFYVESGQKKIQFNFQFKIESKIFIQKIIQFQIESKYSSKNHSFKLENNLSLRKQ